MNYRPVIRSRALRAALAVTLGHAVLGCGTADSIVEVDAVGLDAVADAEDGSGDADADAGSGDVVIDASPTCSGTTDGVCDPSCTQDNDTDCCMADPWCRWNGTGCGCAIEGPFAPPSLALQVKVA